MTEAQEWGKGDRGVRIVVASPEKSIYVRFQMH
jgi:hypothetical protein